MREGRRPSVKSQAMDAEAVSHVGGQDAIPPCHRLRRTPRPHFAASNGASLTRIRRKRRVSGSFSAIPDLARNGRG
jgi:hypothetical protein